jgi:hypothetical protein
MAVPCPLINEILSRQRSPDVFLKYPTFLIRNLHSLLKRERNGLFFLMKWWQELCAFFSWVISVTGPAEDITTPSLLKNSQSQLDRQVQRPRWFASPDRRTTGHPWTT